MARTGKDAVFGDGVLWRTGRRAGHEGISSQDAALVFQGVFPGSADHADCAAGDWYVSVDAMRLLTYFDLWRHVCKSDKLEMQR